ncbi:MAG: hypothetical protein ACRDIE_22380, partial [Chloroflexota bacterium]
VQGSGRWRGSPTWVRGLLAGRIADPKREGEYQMAHKWLYFPFDDVSNDPTMPGNRQRYESKYGQDLTVVGKGQLLSLVGDNEMFIIAGHGLPNSSRIGITTELGTKLDLGKFFGNVKTVTMTFAQSTQVSVTADDLADQLLLSHLPPSHKYIKLITCGGAGMAAVDEAKAQYGADKKTPTAIPVTGHSHETDCLASVLAKALGLRGYRGVMVKGYPGFVNAMGQQKTVTVEATSAAAQFKEWYQTLFCTDGVALGSDYWKGGTVPMVSIPSKLLNDYWFDATGKLDRQHISLKGI